MSGAPPTACRNSRFGCGGVCFPELGHNYCSTCEAAYAKQQAGAKPVPQHTGSNARVTEHDKLIHNSTWTRQTSPTVRALNPICQTIFDDGTRCNRPSKLVHHLDANPAKFWEPSNWVALCNGCHHKGKGENPGAPRFYSPTHWLNGQVFKHNEPPPPGKKLLFNTMDGPVYG